MDSPTTDLAPIDMMAVELRKHDVTAEHLAEIRAKFINLTIDGIDDKAGYQAVHEAHMHCVRLRTTTVKVCKAGREEANRISKEWIEREKEVVRQIEEIEAPLAARKKAIDNAKEAIRLEAERKQREKVEHRLSQLLQCGVVASFDSARLWTDEQFNDELEDAKNKHAEAERIAAEQKAEAERREQEQREEAQRLAAIEAKQLEEKRRLEQERADIEAKQREVAAREEALKIPQQAPTLDATLSPPIDDDSDADKNEIAKYVDELSRVNRPSVTSTWALNLMNHIANDLDTYAAIVGSQR